MGGRMIVTKSVRVFARLCCVKIGNTAQEVSRADLEPFGYKRDGDRFVPDEKEQTMFGDWQWNSKRTDAQSIRLRRWLNGLSEKGAWLAIIEVGAGKAVATVRIMSESIAMKYGAALVRINPRFRCAFRTARLDSVGRTGGNFGDRQSDERK